MDGTRSASRCRSIPRMPVACRRAAIFADCAIRRGTRKRACEASLLPASDDCSEQFRSGHRRPCSSPSQRCSRVFSRFRVPFKFDPNDESGAAARSCRWAPRRGWHHFVRRAPIHSHVVATESSSTTTSAVVLLWRSRVSFGESDPLVRSRTTKSSPPWRGQAQVPRHGRSIGRRSATPIGSDQVSVGMIGYLGRMRLSLSCSRRGLVQAATITDAFLFTLAIASRHTGCVTLTRRARSDSSKHCPIGKHNNIRSTCPEVDICHSLVDTLDESVRGGVHPGS